jgi:TctA family transporter
MSKKPSLTGVAWSAGAASLAGFVAAWVLAARNGDLSDITVEFGPDRFMVAYAIAGTFSSPGPSPTRS